MRLLLGYRRDHRRWRAFWAQGLLSVESPSQGPYGLFTWQAAFHDRSHKTHALSHGQGSARHPLLQGIRPVVISAHIS